MYANLSDLNKLEITSCVLHEEVFALKLFELILKLFFVLFGAKPWLKRRLETFAPCFRSQVSPR